MTYLAVDRNGTEAAFKRKPTRKEGTWNDYRRKYTYEEIIIPSVDGYSHEPVKKLDALNSKSSSKIILPKGSIAKILGRPLYWRDKPYKLKV